MTIIHYLIYYILGFISFCMMYYCYEVPSTLSKATIAMYVILPFVLPFTSRFIRKEHFQLKNLSLIGVTILFFVLFMHILLSFGQNNYITVARTDDIDQVHKIQTIFSDSYIPIRITKDGSVYGIELKYDKRILEYAPVLLVENGLEPKNVNLKIGVDYGDLDTLEERLEKRLEKIIPYITGVYSADVDLTISFVQMDKCCEPIKAKVSVVTDEGFIPERIQNNVANLLLLTVNDLTDENIHIDTLINKCTDDYKCGSEYYGIARKLYIEQKYQEALAMLEKGEKVLPNKYKQSIILLKELINVNKQIEQAPNNYKLYMQRGDIKGVEELAMFMATPQGITSDPIGAISDYSKALELNPNAYEVYARRGKAYVEICKQKYAGYKCIHDQEDVEKGIEDFKKAVKYDKADDYVYEFLGDEYFYQEDYQSAISYYEKISNETLFPTLKIIPKPDVTFKLFNRLPEEYNYLLLRMVTCYKKLKQYDKAKKLCNKILANTDDEDCIKWTKKIMKSLKL